MFKTSVSLSPEKTKFGPLLYSGDLETGLAKASELGFDAVELSLRDSSVLDQKKIMEMLRHKGLKVSSIATGQTYYTDGYSLCHRDGNIREKTVERLKGHIEFASQLDTQVIIGGIRGKFEMENNAVPGSVIQGTKDSIRKCVEYAARRGVTLLLEIVNRYETNFINTVDEAVNLVKELEYDNLKILPDTFHMNIDEADFAESIARGGSLIGLIHFADSNRLAPGHGHIDFDKIIEALNETGYSGCICAEILPKPDDKTAMEQSAGFFNKMKGF